MAMERESTWKVEPGRYRGSVCVCVCLLYNVRYVGDYLSVSLYGRRRQPTHLVHVKASSLVDRLEVDKALSWGLQRPPTGG